MSVSLHTQTGLHCLIIQVINIRVWFLNIWNTSLTSVHSNLEHGLAILTESFSPLKICITQPMLLKSKSEVMQQAMLFLFVMHTKLDQTGLSWFELATANWVSADGLKLKLM